jgi:hypothetical protein
MTSNNSDSTATVPNDCRADPNDVAACAIDGCIYADPEGVLARSGREEMRVFLMAEPERAGSDGYGCGCRKCTGLNRPLSPKDVETVLAHLSPRVATLYALGKVDVRGEKCDKCGKVVAAFTDSVSSTHDALARRRCPYHDHLSRSI